MKKRSIVIISFLAIYLIICLFRYLNLRGELDRCLGKPQNGAQLLFPGLADTCYDRFYQSIPNIFLIYR